SWGYKQYKEGKTLKARMYNFLYRIRLFKLAKLIWIKIKELAKRTQTAFGTNISDFVLAQDIRGSGKKNDTVVDLIEQEINIECLQAQKYNMIGKDLVRQNKPREALGWFEKALLKNKEYKDVYWGFVEAYKQLGEYEKAFKYLTAFIEVAYPADKLTWAVIIEEYMELKQAGFDEAIDWVYEQGGFREKKKGFYISAGEYYQGCRDFARARRCYAKAIEKTGALEAYLLMGKSFMEEGDYPSAIQWFDKATKVYPEDGQAYSFMGSCYGHKGGLKEAMAYFEKSIVVDPGYYESYLKLGIICNGRVDSKKAIEYLEKAIQLNPHSSQAYCELAIAYFGLERFSEGLQYSQQSLSLNPMNSDAYYWTAVMCSRQGHLEKALELLSKGMELAPHDSKFYEEIGLIYREQERHAAAVQYFMAALRLNPNNEHTYDHMKPSVIKSEKIDEVVAFLKTELSNNALASSFSVALQDHCLYETSVVDWIMHDVEQIQDLANKNGIKIILLNYPNAWESCWTNIVERMANKYKLPLVNLHQIFQAFGEDRKKYFIPDGHPNALGYGLIAKNIFDKIIELDLVSCARGD
ncbi:MAG: tetratricopeptide repeat protein, partial [Candidatus Omnitrophica bacterium]|nr:tetratricopeptide repeat protein [Candidatus Omnitrophota bacterium]